jgi:hypothetical protein
MNAEPEGRSTSEIEAARSDEDAAREYRKRLQDVIERMELEYDKALLALHPLGISVTAALYNQMIGSKVEIHSTWLLHFAWAAWVAGILATVLSFRSSILAISVALDQHDEDQPANRKSVWQTVTVICNWSSGLLFVIGVALAAFFLA